MPGFFFFYEQEDLALAVDAFFMTTAFKSLSGNSQHQIHSVGIS